MLVALSNLRCGAITSTHSISILAKRRRRDTLISSGLTVSTFSYAWQSSVSSLMHVFSLGSMSPSPRRKSESGRLIVEMVLLEFHEGPIIVSVHYIGDRNLLQWPRPQSRLKEHGLLAQNGEYNRSCGEPLIYTLPGLY
jgi:hypothetical protein